MTRPESVAEMALVRRRCTNHPRSKSILANIKRRGCSPLSLSWSEVDGAGSFNILSRRDPRSGSATPVAADVKAL